MSKTIDVIIPLRNDEFFVRHAIKSVQMQTYPVNKIIVVNDGSSDSSVEVVRQMQNEDPKIVILENAGIERSSARNTGIISSSAEFIAFLDSDDVWYPLKLERQISMLNNSPGIGVIYANYQMIGASGELLRDANTLPAALKGDVFKSLLLENKISGSCSAVLCRRELFTQVGVFDDTLVYGEDWDMWLRLSRVTDFDFIPESYVFIRARDSKPFKRDTYYSRLFKRAQHLRVWSKWPSDSMMNEEILMRIKGYYLYPHFHAGQSLSRSFSRIKVLERKIGIYLAPEFVRKLNHPVHFLHLHILRNWLFSVPNKVYRKTRRFLSIIKQGFIRGLQKSQTYLAERYPWLGPLKRKIYRVIGKNARLK